jgi:hypothetical protein
LPPLHIEQIIADHKTWLCTTICKSAHSTRLSEKRRIRS